MESPSDPAPGDPAPSESLKPSPGATTVLATAEQVEAEPPTERLDDHQVLRAMRSEAALAQGSTDGEESTTAIRGSATPGELPPDVDATAGREGLEETLRNIRALRDEGRAGEAFERLNRAVREYGPQPTLRSLRDELGEALLERDVEEEESASQIFEVESVPPPAAKSPRDRTPGAPSGASGHSLAEASIRGLSDATIRTFESPSQPVRDRPGPPTAHPTRNMVVAGLALVAIFAAAVYFISRQSPIDERQPLAVEDVTAADLSPGLLAVDAVPWAEIVALENPAVDDPPPISPSRFTPVILSLPPGEYRLTLRYPPSGQVEERLVQVDSDVRVEERIIFENLDAASYFERIGW